MSYSAVKVPQVLSRSTAGIFKEVGYKINMTRFIKGLETSKRHITKVSKDSMYEEQIHLSCKTDLVASNKHSLDKMLKVRVLNDPLLYFWSPKKLQI